MSDLHSSQKESGGMSVPIPLGTCGKGFYAHVHGETTKIQVRVPGIPSVRCTEVTMKINQILGYYAINLLLRISEVLKK